MTVTRHITKSCCGSQTFVLATNKPIRKSQLPIFRDAGFAVPEHFLQGGVFYVQQGGLTATAAFGTTNINVRCNGQNCVQAILNFELLLDKAVNS